ncbi:uncharacterized protein EV420DRAFT_556761 [Desarmillaria tabescens]|uniref:Pentatricopeptide repeat protein n=1 Tax=Armillaria tabescens TaxID=1929756 RepID=A0AA39KBD3_ARMTA|nr:uncharacterized protein EV420DRAFT_556761 [Desarmillaria tabescens]KAK0455698.1 hypothetical protein EV420DRAFT_556761 [Desarmillaria tabescens]
MIRGGLYAGRWARQLFPSRTFTSTIAQWQRERDSGNHQRLLNSLNQLSALLTSPVRRGGNVRAFVQKKLNHRDAYTSSRDIVFQKILTLLVRHRSWDVGISVYERMEAEGLRIPDRLKACFKVAQWLRSPPEQKGWSRVGLRRLFATPSFKERQLLTLMNAFDWSSDATAGAELIGMFIKSKGSRGKRYVPSIAVVNKLVSLQTQAGDLDGAFESLRKLRPGNEEEILRPFVSVIARMSDTGIKDKTSLKRVMNLMKEHDIGADTSVFNVLISREIKLGSFWIYPRVLSYYEVLRNLHAATGIGPDAYTFQHLCSAMGHYYKPRRKHWVQGKDQFTPRHLYRDMVAIHFNTEESKTSSVDMGELYRDQKLLNSMLLMFLTLSDYVGALVCLRGFTKFGIPVNAKTFKHVVEHLARQIHHDKKHWMSAFLGESELDKNMKLMDPRLLTLLLASMKRDKRPGGLGRYVVPTLDMINGEREVPLSARLDLIPLEEALFQALYTAKGRRAGDADETIEQEISDAETLMFPKVPTKNYECGPRRLRRK